MEGYVKDFYGFKTDGEVLFCKSCNVTVVAKKKSQVSQNIESTKHKKTQKNCRRINQSFLSENMNKNITHRDFWMDLCKTLVSADIPLHKLTNVQLSKFIHKYTNFSIPDQTTLRKNYVNVYMMKLF